MASKAVSDAVETYLRANWSDTVVLTENVEQEIPGDGAPFLRLEFPVSNSEWTILSSSKWREEGVFRIVIAVPRGEGMDRMRDWGEELADLFRNVDVGGEACCGVPDEPFSDNESDEGLYFIGSMVVPYYRFGN
jgi:hypothetical protein